MIITAESRQTLLNLVKSYADTLVRMEGEKNHQKALAERAEQKCRLTASVFKALANDYHKDRLKCAKEDLEDRVDWYDCLLDDLDAGSPMD